jgi:NADH-quinone oxidoreductase subunit N
MSISYINELLFINSEHVYSDSVFHVLYNMCTYCIIMQWNPDIELLRCFLPEFYMLFLVFSLLVYCIFFTFSSVLSEEKSICWNTDIAVPWGVRKLIRNKHLVSNPRLQYTHSAWLHWWDIRNRCEFHNISGETAGRNMYGLSMLILLCTLVLLCVFDLDTDLSNTPFSDIILLRTRFESDTIVEFVLLIISLIIFYATHSYNIGNGLASFEYYIIMLFSISSFCFFIHTTNIILLYVLIELQSISSYVLTAMRKNNRYAVEAGLKYFILGSFTSIVLVFGFAMLYGFSGMLHISELSIFVTYLQHEQVYVGFLYVLLHISLLCILIGFLFKIYASPFHFWVADIYQGSPTSVTIFLSTIPVLSYVYVFIKMYVQVLSTFFVFEFNILFILSILSLFSGVAGALVQKKIKKLIAYSSITTIGYILASLSCHSVLLVHYSLYYLFIYVFNILPIFVLLLNYRIYNVRTLDSMYSFTTLFHQNRWFCVLFFSFFFSLAGVPPFAGFFSKLYVFSALGNGSFYPLLLLSICVALLSCYYYLRVIKMAYYDYANTNFFISSIKYSYVYISVLFGILNVSFIFFTDVVDDVCLYLTLCIV